MPRVYGLLSKQCIPGRVGITRLLQAQIPACWHLELPLSALSPAHPGGSPGLHKVQAILKRAFQKKKSFNSLTKSQLALTRRNLIRAFCLCLNSRGMVQSLL